MTEHQYNPKTGNCTCGWEPSGVRGGEAEVARHIERINAGKPG